MVSSSLYVGIAVLLLQLLVLLPSAKAQCYGYPLSPKHDSSDCLLTLIETVSWVAGVRSLDSVPSKFTYWPCPAGCLELNASDPLPRVYGSYPYHGNSSLCLAAIHSGIVNATSGGMVMSSVFFPQDFTNSSTQTIFPFNSSQGTLSNGVQSETVPSTWYSVPSDHGSFSFSLRGRGQFVTQQQQAPFPARAGHLHAHWSSPHGPFITNKFDLIVGGYNDSHYLVTASLTLRQLMPAMQPAVAWHCPQQPLIVSLSCLCVCAG
jgi:hypothetical protein